MKTPIKPRFILETAREEDYVIRFGAIRARRPLAQLTPDQRIAMLHTARQHLATLSEQLDNEIAMLRHERPSP